GARPVFAVGARPSPRRWCKTSLRCLVLDQFAAGARPILAVGARPTVAGARHSCTQSTLLMQDTLMHTILTTGARPVFAKLVQDQSRR
ncbi:hypothetical protein CEXT_753971, partial [Caerostris extrusa]